MREAAVRHAEKAEAKLAAAVEALDSLDDLTAKDAAIVASTITKLKNQ